MMQHSAVSLSLIYYSTWAFCDTSLSQLAWLHIWWFLICEGKKLELAGVRIQFLLIHSELWYRGWWCTVGWFENNLLTSHVSMVPVTFKETGGGTYETKLLTNSNTVDISSLFTICICMGDVRVDFNSNIWSPSCNKQQHKSIKKIKVYNRLRWLSNTETILVQDAHYIIAVSSWHEF